MRAIPAASVALLGVAALSACVPAGAAVGGSSSTFGFTVHPATVAPGGEGHAGGGPRCRRLPGPRHGLVGGVRHGHHPAARVVRDGQVDRDARRGAVYQVTFACAKTTGTVNLTIAGHHSDHPTHEPRHLKGVHAGGWRRRQARRAGDRARRPAHRGLGRRGLPPLAPPLRRGRRLTSPPRVGQGFAPDPLWTRGEALST